MELERRFIDLDSAEIRQSEEDDKLILSGYAAVFNRESADLGGFVEVLEPGCFKRALETNPDVKALFNHDYDTIFARTKNGSLSLNEDDTGLKFIATIDGQDDDGKRIYNKVRSGLVDQCSFAFAVGKDGQEWIESKDKPSLRKITDVDMLADVSVVVSPAYPQTTVQARSILEEAGFDFDALSSLITRAQRGLDISDSDKDTINASIQILQSYLPEESDGGEPDTHRDGDAVRLQNILIEMELLEIKHNRKERK